MLARPQLRSSAVVVIILWCGWVRHGCPWISSQAALGGRHSGLQQKLTLVVALGGRCLACWGWGEWWEAPGGVRAGAGVPSRVREPGVDQARGGSWFDHDAATVCDPRSLLSRRSWCSSPSASHSCWWLGCCLPCSCCHTWVSLRVSQLAFKQTPWFFSP